MASTYSNLKLQLMGTGENSGTWGTITNVNLGTALEEAIVGSADVAFSSGNVTLTLTDTNSTQTARNLRLNLTGTTGGARDLIVPAIEKVYLVNNGCADAITVKNATGTGIAVPAGKTMWVYNTGSDVVDAVTHLSSLTLTTPLDNSQTSAASANGASTIVARDASGNFAANTITAAFSGSGASLTSLNATALASGTVPDARFPSTLPAISGANLTSLNASSLTSGTINTLRVTGSYTGITQVGTLNAGVWNASAISDIYLSTISTAGKVSNSATTATASNGANTIVARDASGNFSAGAITVNGNLAFNSGYGSSAVAYGCRAWINFNGIDNSIRASGNVSSITDVETGTYNVNFTTAMPDADYSLAGMTNGGASVGDYSVGVRNMTASYAEIRVFKAAVGYRDATIVTVEVFR
jgi:hypothetical protein